MTKIQIRKVNGVLMGRPINEHPQFVLHGQQNEINPEYIEFEQSVTEHEAPGFEEGEAEGELVPVGCSRIKLYGYERSPCECGYMTDEAKFCPYRLMEWIVSTPEKVEVKEEHTSGQLIDALKGGKILRRDPYQKFEGQWEYTVCENGDYYYVTGWGSAIGNYKDRLLLVISNPELFEIIDIVESH
jgi:hypothetical protein